ncbi:ribosomal protein L19 [Blastocystis sp. subtype 4]|uniref:ribosomal protein L19 n=1 Tax=Blastocystis sp. subtype 4 TaxID=944170 RepID=UPI000711DA61|nr:ribosomal protein L19 [Blastocystis sp. subtype 4]KNB46322.1 ribosomal protein L19 [Blastocystis sp. subtype 4]|eukprot:XP_014529763.1 ribosomal protein L19 [Blastocystis sp. subtype 4]
MLTSFTSALSRTVCRTAPRAFLAYFSSEIPPTSPEQEKWPPYNVCSLPFNIKPNPNHIKLKEPHKRANSLIKQLSMEAAESARQNMDFDSFRSGDAIEVTMKKRGDSRTEEVFRGVCIAKHNDYYNSTFTIRCNIAGEGVTILFSTYQPDIKSVRLIQESFLKNGERRQRKSKLYYLKDRPILDLKIPSNWTPDRKYVNKKKNNAWLISRGKKPEEE